MTIYAPVLDGSQKAFLSCYLDNLALVERGAAPFGVVYATDAKASRRVRVVDVFPLSTHAPITYPIATLKTATNPQAEAFRRFLTSREGKAIFTRYGFAAR